MTTQNSFLLAGAFPYLFALTSLTLAADAAAQKTAADHSGIHPDRYHYLTEDDLKLHAWPIYTEEPETHNLALDENRLSLMESDLKVGLRPSSNARTIPVDARAYAPSRGTIPSVDARTLPYVPSERDLSASPEMPSSKDIQHDEVLRSLRQTAAPRSKPVSSSTTTQTLRSTSHSQTAPCLDVARKEYSRPMSAEQRERLAITPARP